MSHSNVCHWESEGVEGEEILFLGCVDQSIPKLITHWWKKCPGCGREFAIDEPKVKFAPGDLIKWKATHGGYEYVIGVNEESSSGDNILLSGGGYVSVEDQNTFEKVEKFYPRQTFLDDLHEHCTGHLVIQQSAPREGIIFDPMCRTSYDSQMTYAGLLGITGQLLDMPGSVLTGTDIIVRVDELQEVHDALVDRDS